MAKLNDKERMFCRLIAVEGLNRTEAYVQAFNVKRNSAATLAGRLFARVEIVEEIERLSTRTQQRAECVGVWTKVQRMEELQGWAKEAAQEGKFGDAIRAVAEMNRMDGSYEPEKVDVGVQGTFAALMMELDLEH